MAITNRALDIGTVALSILVLTVAGFMSSPLFHRTGGGARKNTCQTHLKEVYLALRMYTDDYGGVLPSSAISKASDRSFRTTLGIVPPPKWKGYRARTIFELLSPYVRNKEMFFCPSDPTASVTRGVWFLKKTYPVTSFSPSTPTSYVLKKAINQAWLDPMIKARRLKDYKWPSEQVVLYERGNYHWGNRAGDMSDPKNPKKLGATINCAFMDGHVKTVRLTEFEPDYYNTDGKTMKPTRRPEIDPRRYCDMLN